MSDNIMHPTLSQLVPLENIPNELEALRDALASVFDEVYVKNLIVSKSYQGDAGFYTLTLKSYNALGIDIPLASDLKLVLNPTIGGTTEIPIRFDYSWLIIKYIKGFSADTFDNAARSVLDILMDLAEITPSILLQDAVSTFYPPTTLLTDFVNDFNTTYSQAIAVSTDPSLTLNEKIDALYQEIENLDFGIIDVIFNMILDIDGESALERLKLLFASYFDRIEDNVQEVIRLNFNIIIEELTLGLQFPRNWLVPVFTGVEPVTGLELDDPLPEPYFSLLTFNAGSLGYSTKSGFEFGATNSFDMSRSIIGKTGVIVEFDGLKVDLSKDTNIPEANADGRPVEFMGVYAEYAAVTLPQRWFKNVAVDTLQISGRNLLVGTGGISGTVALETLSGLPNDGQAYLDVEIGNWKIGFNYFDMTFRQNVVTESNIEGLLTIPKLKNSAGTEALVTLKGHLNEEGDFNLTASEPDGIQLSLFNFVNFNFLSLELGREDDNFYIGTSCQIWFENEFMQKILGDQVIEIPKLRVYDNGTIEIVGGTGTIPVNISLDLGPVEIAVTGIHYGSVQREHGGNMRKYNYWGFDGAISLDPLGIDARGEGIKYYYTVDNDEFGGDGDHYLHISTIELDLIIPGTANPAAAVAIIHGMVSIPEPGDSPEYIGEVSLKLPKAKIAGGAAMRLQPRHPAFLVDAFIDLPAPIPIGPLGIYGFRGLLGFRYVAEKEAIGLVSGEDTWYDYYTYPPKGVHISKFSGPERTSEYEFPFSIGAGAVVGTSFDSGTIISIRAMLLLSIPTLFLVEGRASILSARLGLTDDREPPFFAFVAWGDNSIEMGMGADFNIPQDGSNKGWIIDLDAEIQAGFFFDYPSAWYVNFGTRDNPISARILTIITAQSYLMLSAQGIEAGARVEFELRKRFGPARVYLYAYLEMGGFISFERPQVGGYIAAGGTIEIDIWIVSVSISLDAIFSAEAAKPFLIYAEIQLRVCVKILFAKICKSFTIKLKWEKNNQVERSPIPPLTFPTGAYPDKLERREELVKGVHMLTNDAFDITFLGMNPPSSPTQIEHIIPMDTYIEFKTEKGLVPGAISDKIGGYTFPPENHVNLIPPEKVVRGGRELRQVKHRYSIEDIEVKAWNGSSWMEYHPFEAVVHEDDRPNVEDFRIGYWQIKEKQYDTIRLLATTPFTYMEAGEPGWSIPEIYGITPSTLFCSEELRIEDCADVLEIPLGTKYYPPTQFIGHYIDGAYFTLSNVEGYEIIDGNIIVIDNEFMEVTDEPNVHGFEKSLAFNNYNSMVVILPEPSVNVKLRLTTNAQGATIKYYKSIIDDTTSTVQYEEVHSQYKTAAELDGVVEYENLDSAMTKVIIEPDDPNIAEILDLLEQIAELFEITYDEATGEVTISEPTNVQLYNQLLAQLNALKAESCSGSDCNPDPKLCDLYEALLALYEACFIYPVQTVQQIKEQLKCFHDFNQLILDFDKECPEYQLILQIDFLYAVFAQKLKDLDYLLNNPGGISDTAIINIYYEFRDCAFEVMEAIKNLGDCDCDPKEKCDTTLQQVCWLTLENHEWNETIPGSGAIEGEHQDMIEAIQKTVQPIWRPNTSFYVKYTLKDEVDNGESNPGVYDYYYGFKTVGPLGHYHNNPAVDYLPAGATADEYPLTSLRSYIDYNRSYPNADGSLLRAKPLFYGHREAKISLFFAKPLTYHMLNNWYPYLGMPALEGALHIAIKDPVTDVIIPYPLPVDYDEETVPFPDEQTWVDDMDPRIPPHIQAIIGMIQNGEIPCDIVLGDLIAPASQAISMILTNLKPRKLYTALLYNAFEASTGNVESQAVHQFVFQTSRYADFASQVNSYLLQDESLNEGQAVFEINVTVDVAAANQAYDIVANPEDQTLDPLGTQYQHLFDRVTEGLLEMTPLDPPVTTEFNKIINTTTGKVIAILIRNPEPFNNPKIPIEEINGTIQALFANGNVYQLYKVLHSNDYSQAIIMRASNNITNPMMHFKFTYLEWDGSEYVEAETIVAGDIIINE